MKGHPGNLCPQWGHVKEGKVHSSFPAKPSLFWGSLQASTPSLLLWNAQRAWTELSWTGLCRLTLPAALSAHVYPGSQPATWVLNTTTVCQGVQIHSSKRRRVNHFHGQVNTWFMNTSLNLWHTSKKGGMCANGNSCENFLIKRNSESHFLGLILL